MSESEDTSIHSLQIKGVDSVLDNLANCGYGTLEKLARTNDRELRRIRGMGPRTLEKIKEAVKATGIEWTGKPYNPIPLGPLIKLDTNAPVMNLRDWFAGQALTSHGSSDYSPMKAAEQAYKYADAMLAERVKEVDDE